MIDLPADDKASLPFYMLFLILGIWPLLSKAKLPM
jgi:hypothetical protein